jgi:hypothetical protein
VLEAARRDGAPDAWRRGPAIAEAEGPEATPASGLNALRGTPVRDRREKIRTGAIPRGGCRRGKEWEASSRLAAALPPPVHGRCRASQVAQVVPDSFAEKEISMNP